MEDKQTRTVDVGFTKISDDVIVPTWRAKGGEGAPLKITAIVWWVLGAFWLLCISAFVKTQTLTLLSGCGITGFALFLGLMFQLGMKFPEKWIEFNHKDGFVSVWTSRKKRRLIGRWPIDQVGIKMNCRWISSGPKGQTSEHRYRIELFDKNPVMKNTPFWKFDNHPQRKGVPFFVLFDLFGDPHSFTEESDFALASAITHQVEKFIRDFMAGRLIPESSTSTYTFTVPE
jgi:hypothetical protein